MKQRKDYDKWTHCQWRCVQSGIGRNYKKQDKQYLKMAINAKYSHLAQITSKNELKKASVKYNERRCKQFWTYNEPEEGEVYENGRNKKVVNFILQIDKGNTLSFEKLHLGVQKEEKGQEKHAIKSRIATENKKYALQTLVKSKCLKKYKN